MRRITNRLTIFSFDGHPRRGLPRTASAPVGAQAGNDVNDLGLRKVSSCWTTSVLSPHTSKPTDAPQLPCEKRVGNVLPPPPGGFSKQSLDSSDMADAGCPRAQLGEQARSKSAPPRLEK